MVKTPSAATAAVRVSDGGLTGGSACHLSGRGDGSGAGDAESSGWEERCDTKGDLPGVTADGGDNNGARDTESGREEERCNTKVRVHHSRHSTTKDSCLLSTTAPWSSSSSVAAAGGGWGAREGPPGPVLSCTVGGGESYNWNS